MEIQGSCHRPPPLAMSEAGAPTSSAFSTDETTARARSPLARLFLVRVLFRVVARCSVVSAPHLEGLGRAPRRCLECTSSLRSILIVQVSRTRDSGKYSTSVPTRNCRRIEVRFEHRYLVLVVCWRPRADGEQQFGGRPHRDRSAESSAEWFRELFFTLIFFLT